MDNARRTRGGGEYGLSTRVALLTSEVSPYRAPLFARLAGLPGIRLKVFAYAERSESRMWNVQEAHDFELRILRTVQLGARMGMGYYVLLESLRGALHEFGPDLVICGGWESTAALQALGFCRARRIPFLLWSGQSRRMDRALRPALANLLHDLSRPLARFVAKRADACIAYGTAAREYLASLGAAPERISVALNAVDNDRFRKQYESLRHERDALRRSLSIGPEETAILHLGYFRRRKGIADLLGAFGRICRQGFRAKLLLVGDGPLRDRLAGRAMELGVSDSVIFPGYVQQEDVAGYYVAADIFVLPTYSDPWGLVLNEAMNFSLPVITTVAAGASRDIVEDGVNGFVIEPGNVGQLTGRIAELAADKSLRAAFGRAGREIVLKASIEAAAGEFGRAIARAQGGHRRA